MNKLKLLVLIILAQFLNSNVFGQIELDYANAKTYKIAEISITGVRYLNHQALVQLSGLQVGDEIKIPGEEITKSMRKLWKQGLFSDVKISYTKIVGDSIYLDIYLQERPRLSKVEYSGLSKSLIKDFQEKIDLKRGSQVTDYVINKVKTTIKNHFVSKGFFYTKVTTVIKDDSTLQNAVILYVNVEKSKKVRIKKIKFVGNTVFEEKKLKKFLKNTKERRWYGLFKPSKYIPEKYKDNKIQLVSKLYGKGYRDAKIISDTLINNDDNTISLTLNIEEGRKFYFRNITWVGNKKFSSEQLTKVLKIKKGDIYDQSVLDKRLNIDEDAVGNLYMNDGYLFFSISPVEIQIVNDSIDLEMRLYEGPQARIKNVIITGNTRTNDHVIRREIRTFPGELFSREDVIRTIRELAQLGHFDPEQIIPTPRPNPEDGTVDLEYSLVEKANDQIELSGGWGAGMIVGTLGLRFNNFSTKNFFEKKAWQPLPTGDGQQLSIRAQTNGVRYQSYSATFVEPWLGGRKPNSLSISVNHTIQSASSYDYYANTLDRYMKVTGGSVGFGRRLKWPDDYFTLYNEVSFRHYTFVDYEIFENLANGIAKQLAFNTVFSRSSIDNPLYGRTGSSFSLGLEFTLPISLWNNKDYSTMTTADKYEWLEYHKWTFKASWFTQLIGKLVLNTKAEYGFVGYYNEKIGQAPTEGYEIGGDGMGYYVYGKTIIGLRGYENGSVTPTEGGNLYNKFSAELRYLITHSQSATIYALSFVEAGNAFDKFSNYNPFKLYRSSGVGVRVFLPMLGLIGIDWAYGFDEIPGRPDNNGGRFHFILGQQF
ncbi:MAG: outer membrane protein assembly factor BamA [Bacteroidales bacterium]|nr:outer membrane protein assembly factor BamA [Bacteroidales bacterium]MBN2758377.1 outer membrane protein assembly factor BamA [Bacteroidales bacterium]